jgi:predicted RNA-binding protein with PIN domain
VSLGDPDDEAQLVRLLVSYRARTGRKITVVFDPGGAFALSEVRRQGGVEVVFAPHGSTADSVIARRVRRSRNPRGWLVVTSDRKLADTVTQLGARVRSASDFALELSPASDAAPEDFLPPEKGTPPTPEEVDAWLALFEDQG